MLPRRRKVSRKLFSTIIGRGKSLHSSHLSLKITSASDEESKLSVTIPKKIEKSAVKRNTLKRKVYRVLQEYIDLIPPHNAGVFFAKPGIHQDSVEAIRTQVKELLKKSFNHNF
jgi:ribonuclease P protein component